MERWEGDGKKKVTRRKRGKVSTEKEMTEGNEER